MLGLGSLGSSEGLRDGTESARKGLFPVLSSQIGWLESRAGLLGDMGKQKPPFAAVTCLLGLFSRFGFGFDFLCLMFLTNLSLILGSAA